jgi:putative SOS response-associated peptidase YedK
MCCRFLLLQQHFRELLEKLGLDDAPEFLTRYNIAPGSLIPAVRTRPRTAKRETVALRWGLVHAWAQRDDGAKLVNARAETVAEKPSFRDALRQRRCVIPASGFYEWEHRGQARLPWLFRRRDEQPFGFAGLWESWRAPDGAQLETCTFVTTTPNELMRPIHDRMPVMLSPGEFDLWLDPGINDPARIMPLLHPPVAAGLQACRVSRRVGNVRYEAPDCLAPATDDDEDDTPQLSLGLE